MKLKKHSLGQVDKKLSGQDFMLMSDFQTRGSQRLDSVMSRFMATSPMVFCAVLLVSCGTTVVSTAPPLSQPSTTGAKPSSFPTSTSPTPQQPSHVACSMTYGISYSTTTTAVPFAKSPYAFGGGIPSGLMGSVSVYTMTPYGKTSFGMIAPKGWKCQGVYGADGGVGMTVRGGNSMAVELSVPNGAGPSISQAAPFFSSARAMETWLHPLTVIGETSTRLSSTEVQYTDPPLVKGNGQLSGGHYSDMGLVIWIPGVDMQPPTSNGGYSMQVDCAMPASDQDICRAVLNFAIDWYSSGTPQ